MLHAPYLEMSDRDQMSGTLKLFHAVLLGLLSIRYRGFFLVKLRSNVEFNRFIASF